MYNHYLLSGSQVLTKTQLGLTPKTALGVSGGAQASEPGELLHQGARVEPLELKMLESRIGQEKLCPSELGRNYIPAIIHPTYRMPGIV